MSQRKRLNEYSSARSNESGFSIIEMLIAVTVILVGLISIAGISVYVSRANQTSNTLNVLASAAQDQVDRLRTAVWNVSTEDPTLSVGGSLESAPVYTPSTPDGEPQPMTAGMTGDTTTSSSTASTSSAQTSHSIYTYTLDPDNPHRATVASTPAGDLKITWQVRQGTTPDLRYVTIRVVQVYASPSLEDGFTVTTIVSRN